VYEDIHGVADAIDEKPQFVVKRLKQLAVELETIPLVHRQAYNKALLQYPAYVQDREFRISFLRADRFDVKQAAKRLVLYFEQKLEYFGAALLTKNIAFDDLEEDDKEALMTGSFQFFSDGKDEAGRTVMFNMIRHDDVI
jgi:hypothetical protein